MNNVIDSVPQEHRETFVQVLQQHNSVLLNALRAQEAPTIDQADDVTDVFARAFIVNVGPDEDHPTERAVQIDDALGAFLKRWPVEVLEES